MIRVSTKIALAVSLALPASGIAQDEPARRPRIGLVLSGGGARGITHIGVLKVLEELRIPVDFIAGTSMGAIVGGLYAYGMSPAELERIVTEADWDRLTSDTPLRDDVMFRRKQDQLKLLIDLNLGFRDGEFRLPLGVAHGQKIGLLLSLLAIEGHDLRSFDDLRIPYRAVATDISTGHQIVLDKGSLPRAMSASMAVPGVFAPIEVDGKRLVDGGIVNNVPVDVAREMGAEVVIVVDIGSPLLTADEIQSVFSVSMQMVSILMQKNVDEQIASLTAQDLLIRPDLADISATDFAEAARSIGIGEKCARANAGQLGRFSVSKAEWQRYIARQRRPKVDPPRVRQILFDNGSGLADRVLARRMSTRPGDVLDADKLSRDVSRIYGLWSFSRVGVRIDQHEDGADVVIDADRKTWGPNYVRMGLDLADDFDGSATYQFRVDYTMTELNELGGEWKVVGEIGQRRQILTEFYQPLDSTGDLFISPRLGYSAIPFDLVSGGQKVAELDVQGALGTLDVGTVFGTWGELRVGGHWFTGTNYVESATTPIQDTPFDDFAIVSRFSIDTLDIPTIPSRGLLGAIEHENGLAELGGENDYQVVRSRLSGVVPIGRSSLAVITRAGSTLEGDAPVFRGFTLGGFLRLSGLKPRELIGRHSVLGAVAFYHQLAGSREKAFGMPIYAGFSLEAGNVWQTRNAIRFDSLIPAGSVFVGADTPVGPVYVAYGRAEQGRKSFYLSLGRVF